MFVTNCKVLNEEILRFPKRGVLNKNKRNKGNGSDQSTDNANNGTQTIDTAENPGDEDVYNPVKCEQCNTEVGVFDKDEVYHFFNVLASY